MTPLSYHFFHIPPSPPLSAVIFSDDPHLKSLTLSLQIYFFNINLLLTEREGRTGEYWPEVVTVRTVHREVRTKTTEGQYSPVRLEQARLVSSLLYGTRHEIHDLDRFRGNGPYGKIPTEKEPITTLRFT